SCSSTDVGTAVATAQNGDTVLIPPGTCTWTTGVMGAPNCSFGGFDHSLCNGNGTSKYLTIQGAGIGQTVIIDQTQKGSYAPAIFYWLLNPNGPTRITGIEVRGSVGMPNCSGNTPSIYIAGDSNQFRLDHNKFVTHSNCPGLVISGYVRGVADHNYWDVSDQGYCAYIHHTKWGNVSSDAGDNSWAQPDTVGTAEAMFFEDNIFFNDQSVSA